VTYVSQLISDCISNRGGEVYARNLAIELGMIYLYLSVKGRQRFLRLLALRFDSSKEKLEKIFRHYLEQSAEDDKLKIEMNLSDELISPRLVLLKHFNAMPNGFKFLINLREDLLTVRKDSLQLMKLEKELKLLLAAWFDVGLLDLKEISWDSPASLLEKLIEYEAVHEIQSWEDLKSRLVRNRICYGFFHPKLPLEPLVFVEIALARKIPNSIQKLLAKETDISDLLKTEVAIFYSISSTQKGLGGIKLGNFLIKRVVKELKAKLPDIKHFVTLSPIPEFRQWLNPLLAAGDDSIFLKGELDKLKAKIKDFREPQDLLKILNDQWYLHNALASLLKPLLMRLCASYLFHAKKGQQALDSVTHFHLTNGALLYRLNWQADLSEKGMAQSAGIMANYYYDIQAIEKNHEAYIGQGRIEVGKDMQAWLKF
jgi:malonyl-CoA decarboxylase